MFKDVKSNPHVLKHKCNGFWNWEQSGNVQEFSKRLKWLILTNIPRTWIRIKGSLMRNFRLNLANLINHIWNSSHAFFASIRVSANEDFEARNSQRPHKRILRTRETHNQRSHTYSIRSKRVKNYCGAEQSNDCEFSKVERILKPRASDHAQQDQILQTLERLKWFHCRGHGKNREDSKS